MRCLLVSLFSLYLLFSSLSVQLNSYMLTITIGSGTRVDFAGSV